MVAIGFRVEPKAVHWAVVRGSKDAPVLVADGSIPAPKTYTEAAKLTYFRDRVATIIDQHQPAIAAVRYPETFGGSRGQTSQQARSRIEGVLLECANSKGLGVITGALKTISSKLGSQSAKAYLVQDELRSLDWSRKGANVREAILVGVAALGDQAPDGE
jgi:hypothetical protein